MVPFKRVLLPAVQWEQRGCLDGTLYVRCVDPFDEKLDIKHHFMCSDVLRRALKLSLGYSKNSFRGQTRLRVYSAT